MINNFLTQPLNGNTPTQDIRILLWDIDGTLLQSGIKGSFKEYFANALEKVYGTSGKISEVNAAGSTRLPRRRPHPAAEDGRRPPQGQGRLALRTC